MNLSRRDILFIVFGFLGGLGWFIFNQSIDFKPYPVAADAVSYATISNSFSSIWEALRYAGDRTFGFPFFLYLIKIIFSVFGDLTPETLHRVQSLTLFSIHSASSIYFFLELRKHFHESNILIHPLFVLILLIHPGLISHTSVLLTDTLMTDLLMIIVALILRSKIHSPKSGIIGGLFTGILLGWAIAIRPFFIVSFFAFLALTILFSFKDFKKILLFFIPATLAAALALLPASLQCRNLYGKFCLQNPEFASYSVSTSLQLGLDSYRTYWSMRSALPSQIVTPKDELLESAYKDACDVSRISGPKEWIECTFSKPLLLPTYGIKKIIALFDHFILQPYAADVTPAWVRVYSRVFSSFAFGGFFLLLWQIFYFFRNTNTQKALALSLPTLTLLFQIPMHVEGRYSFAVLPLCYFAAIYTIQKSSLEKPRSRMILAACFFVVCGVFILQVNAWDLDDLILQQIEGWVR